MSISLLDMGCGNISCIENAIYEIGHSVNVIKLSEVKSIPNSSTMIIPGVGNFEFAAKHLNYQNYFSDIKNFLERDGRIIGICLGMQLLFESSDEGDSERGLCLLKGHLRGFKRNNNLKTNVGYRYVEDVGFLYFIHSYYLPVEFIDENKFVKVKTMQYQGKDFVAYFETDKIIGCQFHPEKSLDTGLNFLKKICDKFVE